MEGSSEMETSGQTTEGCIYGNKSSGYQVGESANGRKSRCKVMRWERAGHVSGTIGSRVDGSQRIRRRVVRKMVREVDLLVGRTVREHT